LQMFFIKHSISFGDFPIFSFERSISAIFSPVTLNECRLFQDTVESVAKRLEVRQIWKLGG
jgi:hypothetical protein